MKIRSEFSSEAAATEWFFSWQACIHIDQIELKCDTTLVIVKDIR